MSGADFDSSNRFAFLATASGEAARVSPFSNFATGNHPVTNPRVVVFSQRGLRPKVSRCSGFEFEDVLASVTNAQIVSPTHNRFTPLAEPLINRLNKRFVLGAKVDAPFGCATISAQHDILFALFQLPSDLVALSALRDSDRFAKKICFIEEMWAADLDRWKGHIERLNEFDHVFLASAGTVSALQQRLTTPVSFLPFGVDALKFGPRDADKPRPIDVNNIGRRSAVTHLALREWARSTGRMYYFDTFTPGYVYDFREHRELLATVNQASKYVITNRGIGANPERTNWQAELSFKYFEVVASGGIIVGEPPTMPEFEKLFDWEDASVDVPFDCADIGDVLEELDADPARVARARKLNLRAGYERHDGLYRVEEMFEAVGVSLGDKAAERRAELLKRSNAL